MGEIGAGFEVAKWLRESLLLPTVIDIYLCEWAGKLLGQCVHTVCSVINSNEGSTHTHTHTHTQLYTNVSFKFEYTQIMYRTTTETPFLIHSHGNNIADKCTRLRLKMKNMHLTLQESVKLPY